MSRRYLVCGVDPGETHCGLIVVDLYSDTNRVVRAAAVSMKQICNLKKRPTRTQMHECVRKLIGTMPYFFSKEKGIRHIFVESQMKQVLIVMQTAFLCFLYERCSLTSPRIVRQFFDISVSKKDVPAHIKNKRAWMYRRRKILSVEKAYHLMSVEDQGVLGAAAVGSAVRDQSKAVEDMMEAWLLVICKRNHGVLPSFCKPRPNHPSAVSRSTTPIYVDLVRTKKRKLMN